MIIDSHAHVMMPVEKQFFLMDEASVDKTVLFSTTPHPELANSLHSFENEMNVLNNILTGTYSPEERIQNIARTTSEMCSRIKQYPDKFFGFGTLPLSLPLENILSWIDTHIISNGLLGLGEITLGTGQTQLLENIFIASGNFGQLPLWIHTFHPLDLSDLKRIAVLAEKYNDIPVVFGHIGGVNWIEAIKIAKTLKNIYLDLSATYTVLAPKLAIAELPDRVLFSSDAPYGNPMLIRKMVEMVSPNDAVTERVLGGNIGELLWGR